GKARGSSSARPQRFASPRASYTNAVGRSHRTKRHSTIPAPEAAARAGAGADQRTVNAMHETLNLHGRPIGDRGSPRRLLRRFWRTASRYWSGKSCTKAWGLSGGLLLAIVLLVAAAYAINLWNRAIFDGLQSKDASAVARLSFVLLTFGAAIGLSATSPWPNSGLPTRLVASLAVFCTMAQQIGAVMVGGYVAGRMRTRWHESGHEAEFRDGLHGALVWAIGVLISTLLVFTTLG